MFLPGVIQLIIPILFWLVELTGRYLKLWDPLGTVIPATSVHIYLMLFAVFPFFIFGFLFTTYPKWMNGEVIPKNRYLLTFKLMTSGLLLFYFGLFTSKSLLMIGIFLHMAGWISGIYALYSVYSRVDTAVRYHASHLNAALAFGLFGEIVYFLWLEVGGTGFLGFAVNTGFWLFLIPIFIIVLHRMLPFFTSCVVENYTMHKPMWSLPFLWVCLAGHFLLEIFNQGEWLFLFDLPLSVFGLYHVWIWGFNKSLQTRLLAVLHISSVCFAAGTALFAIQSLFLNLTGNLILGKAPLHALAIGFVTSTVISMVTRVSLGHSGRPLVMDRYSWICFWMVLLTACLRILAEIETVSLLLPVNLNLLAAIVWLCFITPWIIRYGSIYLKPRVDGQPG